MSLFRTRTVSTTAVLFCIITFTAILFIYTYRDPLCHINPSSCLSDHSSVSKALCKCPPCMAELEEDPWFAERFNQSIHPLMTGESSVLTEETFTWWQSLQKRGQTAEYTDVVEELFSFIPDKAVYMDASPDRCRTCSVVGNSGKLKGSRYGQLIDASDFVIRINEAPTRGFEEDVGTRRTHHVFYPESAIDLDSDTVPVLIPFKTQDLQWLVSALTSGTDNMTVKHRTKMNKDKVLTYNPTFMKYVHESWVENHGQYPSTGILTLLLAIHICDKVSVFGFGANEYGNWHHYWDENYMAGTVRHEMVHDGEYEYRVILLLAEKHKIQVFKGR